jgi:hypothetical protein
MGNPDNKEKDKGSETIRTNTDETRGVDSENHEDETLRTNTDETRGV